MRLPIPAALLLTIPTVIHAATTPETFRATLAQHVTKLDQQSAGAVKADDGWFFLTNELRAYSKGIFWGADAAKTSAAEKNQDPLPAILEFHEMLKSKGIELIMIPVPGKVCVYGDKLDRTLASDVRLDDAHQKFLALLSEKGVATIDLTPHFLEMRKNGTAPFCQQDSHWSPAAIRLTAGLVAAAIKKLDWYTKQTPKKVDVAKVETGISGDLIPLVTGASASEKLTIEQVKIDGNFLKSDRESPLVLIGDSHTLVFHEELLADHAGFPDLLCAELGLTIDIMGVRGSGANGSRGNLARRKDNLAGKKCVVWCFTAREFTESISGWQKIPVIRQ